MTENQKDQPVQSNQGNNPKQDKPDNQGRNEKQGDPTKKSPEPEVEKELTEEIKEQDDVKHPHKQGVPVSFQDRNKS